MQKGIRQKNEKRMRDSAAAVSQTWIISLKAYTFDQVRATLIISILPIFRSAMVRNSKYWQWEIYKDTFGKYYQELALVSTMFHFFVTCNWRMMFHIFCEASFLCNTIKNAETRVQPFS